MILTISRYVTTPLINSAEDAIALPCEACHVSEHGEELPGHGVLSGMGVTSQYSVPPCVRPCTEDRRGRT